MSACKGWVGARKCFCPMTDLLQLIWLWLQLPGHISIAVAVTGAL